MATVGVGVGREVVHPCQDGLVLVLLVGTPRIDRGLPVPFHPDTGAVLQYRLHKLLDLGTVESLRNGLADLLEQGVQLTGPAAPHEVADHSEALLSRVKRQHQLGHEERLAIR